MKKFETVLMMANALSKGDFGVVCEKNLTQLEAEFSEFSELIAGGEYRVFTAKDGFQRCLDENIDFFLALAVIAREMPSLLRHDDLKDLMIKMYQSSAYFQGEIKVLEACGAPSTFIAIYADLHIEEPEVRAWCKANIEICDKDDLFEAMKEKMPLMDGDLVNLCKPFYKVWIFCLTFFLLGLLIGGFLAWLSIV